MTNCIIILSFSDIGKIKRKHEPKEQNDNDIVRYLVQDKEPSSKWIELKRLTGEYSFVDKVGNDSRSLYIPILGLEKCTFTFPL